MRFGIFADIHGNLEALQAVLADMETQRVERPLCVGDIVGYNANPAECLEIVRGLNCPVVMGNHDEAATWDLDPRNFNPFAKQAIQYTKAQLSQEQRSYLARLPLIRNFDSFALVHSEFLRPDAWIYVLNPDDARPSLQRQRFDICFFGHTHVPHMFVEDGRWVREFFYRKFVIKQDKKYFVNVGSVGQPRDGDWRSAYVIFDTSEQTVELRRVVYNLAKTQQKIIEVGLPRRLAERLAESY